MPEGYVTQQCNERSEAHADAERGHPAAATHPPPVSPRTDENVEALRRLDA